MLYISVNDFSIQSRSQSILEHKDLRVEVLIFSFDPLITGMRAREQSVGCGRA